MQDVIIFGRNAVLEALLSDSKPDTVYIEKGASGLGKHVALAKESGAVVKDCDAEKLNKLTDNARHGGIAAVLSQIEYSELDEILDSAKEKGMPPFIIIADEIEDPHNLGALIRTAEAAGADGLVIPKRRSASVNSTVFASSAGAASWLKICRTANLSDVIKKLKAENIWVYGAETDGEPFYQTDFSGGVCLVIGSEGKGLSRLVKENCDKIVSIDMYGKISSLNASVSGGILMYEIVKYRRKNTGA